MRAEPSSNLLLAGGYMGVLQVKHSTKDTRLSLGPCAPYLFHIRKRSSSLFAADRLGLIVAVEHKSDKIATTFASRHLCVCVRNDI